MTYRLHVTATATHFAVAVSWLTSFGQDRQFDHPRPGTDVDVYFVESGSTTIDTVPARGQPEAGPLIVAYRLALSMKSRVSSVTQFNT